MKISHLVCHWKPKFALFDIGELVEDPVNFRTWSVLDWSALLRLPSSLLIFKRCPMNGFAPNSIHRVCLADVINCAEYRQFVEDCLFAGNQNSPLLKWVVAINTQLVLLLIVQPVKPLLHLQKMQFCVFWLCTVVDKCAYNNGGCSSLATCTNTHYGRKCTCIEGYIGDGLTCRGKT